MNEIKEFKVSVENGLYIIEFDSNHILKKINITTEEKINGDIVLEFAQNGITSELMLLGSIKAENESELELCMENSVSASHIYLCMPSDDIKIRNVCIYEEEEADFSKYYPYYKEINLNENYYLDTVSIFTEEKGYLHYSIYTSMNGRDFELLATKQTDVVSDSVNGDIYNANGKEARFIRVHIEYNSASAEAEISDIRFTGNKSNTPVVEYPQVNICDFEKSIYNVEITQDDVYEELNGIIKRRTGVEYISWFDFQLAENPVANHSYDYYEISNNNDKIRIKGNNGVSLATGLNYYLKYYCKVNISQTGDRVRMPSKPVPVNNVIFKETRAKVRYAYNYCTLSYSMAFWGEKEWRDELDWLALNGVNVVLDTTAQEEVWRRFMGKLGYSHAEIKKYIAGPAYYAWAYMANLYGYGGPVHDTWFEERTELARKNHFAMRKLGMYPVLQGYSGMVPVDITEYDENIDVIPQGTWCSFVRPSMIKTTSPCFSEYALKFYQSQKEVYGTYSKYYATDPFHEGGKVSGMSLRSISGAVLKEMLKFDNDAVWIIQSWQSNPSSELLAGLEEVENGKEHALILDLYAEKTPHYNEGHRENPNHGYSPEFDNTPWVFCMLNNFGGRLGLHGHLDNLTKWIPSAYNECKKINGIGITPEASVNNPVLYEFLFECIWQDNADEKMQEKNLDEWLRSYSERRYGAKSESAFNAWKILKETVYKAELNNIGQGAPECIINARPSADVKTASTWGNTIISYDKNELKKACELLMEDYEAFKESEGYKYDLISVIIQIISNNAQDCYHSMIKAYNEGNLYGFEKLSQQFLEIADDMDKATGGNKYYLLGRWLEQAKALAKNTDDFTKKLYEMNARSLITTWGAYNQSEKGMLHDYSNRQWSGLIKDFYKPRWERWIKARINEMNNAEYEDNINWFETEWAWVRDNKAYNPEAENLDIYKLGRKVTAK